MSDLNVANPNPSAPTGGETPAPAPSPGVQGAPNAVQSATPTGTPAGATPSAPIEDRSTWVPPYRLRETREAALREAQRQFSERETQYQSQLEQVQAQLRALVGVQQPQNPEVSAIREQFGQLYPGLTQLEERAKELMAVLERSGDLETQNQHYWQSYGRQTMDRLFTKAQETLGGPLTDEGKRVLHSAFVGFVQSSPELSERYSSDPSVVEDFWKIYTSNIIDPVRRSAAAGVAGRAPGAIPQDTPGGTPRVTPAPRFGSLDERAAAGWAQYQQTKTR